MILHDNLLDVQDTCASRRDATPIARVIVDWNGIDGIDI